MVETIFSYLWMLCCGAAIGATLMFVFIARGLNRLCKNNPELEKALSANK